MTADASPDDDLWSWVDDEPEPLADVPSGKAVTAVMVVRNGESWLADALASVAASTVRPARLLAVDNGSDDGSRELLDAAAHSGQLEVVDGDAAWGFGRAVAAAVAQAEPTDWLWLLHDDVVVAPTALERLLEQTVRTPDADILGPMLLRPARRRAAAHIVELGVSISHTGRRELGLEPGEVAQGQHEPRETLGVSTCGMLIRRTTYDALGGFDDAVPLHRDGVELGWRATLAGHRVVTCPDARITHRSAGRRGRRVDTLVTVSGRSPASYDRTMAMRTVAGHASGAAVPFVTLRLLVGSLLRALGFLLGKRVDLARSELGAARAFLGSGAEVSALRRRVRGLGATAEARRRVARLRPHLWSSWGVGLDRVARAGSERFRAFTSGSEAASIDELTGDDFADHSRTTRGLAVPAVASLALLLGVLVAGRRLAGLGEVTSSGLLPAPGSPGVGFASYLSGDHPAWLGLAALGSLPFVVPSWAAVAALFLGVPAAAVACAWFLEPYVLGVRARWLTALLYGLLPVLVGGYSRGQVWLIVWAVVLPLFGVAVRTWRPATGLEGWRAPAGAALALALLGAVAPLAVVFGAIVVVAVSVRRGAGLLRPAVSVSAALLLLSPWLPALLRHPGRLLTGPEPLLGSLDTSPAWGMLLGRSAGPGLPPLWLSLVVVGLLWLGAVLALWLRPTAWPVWAAAVGCLVVAVVVSRPIVTVAGGGVRAEVTMWLVTGLGLLLVGSAAAVDRARADLADSDFGLGQATVLASSVVGALALVLSLGWWIWGGVGAPVGRSDGSSVPVYVRDAENALGSRALLVSLSDGSVTWFLDEPGRPRWGDGERGLVLGGDPGAVAAARTAAAEVASGGQVDGLAAHLAALGVSHVRVSGATPEVLAALGSTPGLQRGTDEASGAVWLVTGKPGRHQIVDGSTVASVGATVPSGPAGRVLVVAEPPDSSRTVTVGGTPLATTTSPDWRAAYDLGTASGPLTVTRAAPASWWAWLQLAGLALLALFAAPTLRRDEDVVAHAVPRRASAAPAAEAEVLP